MIVSTIYSFQTPIIWIIILDDEIVFVKIENLINESIQRPKPTKLTKQDLLDRAIQSNNDIDINDVYTVDAVEKLSQKW